jgi:hypothetical protein
LVLRAFFGVGFEDSLKDLLDRLDWLYAASCPERDAVVTALLPWRSSQPSGPFRGGGPG